MALDGLDAVGHELGVLGVVRGHRQRVSGVEEILECPGEPLQFLGIESR
jgi:hypothetical protein